MSTAVSRVEREWRRRRWSNCSLLTGSKAFRSRIEANRKITLTTVPYHYFASKRGNPSSWGEVLRQSDNSTPILLVSAAKWQIDGIQHPRDKRESPTSQFIPLLQQLEEEDEVQAAARSRGPSHNKGRKISSDYVSKRDLKESGWHLTISKSFERWNKASGYSKDWPRLSTAVKQSSGRSEVGVLRTNKASWQMLITLGIECARSTFQLRSFLPLDQRCVLTERLHLQLPLWSLLTPTSSIVWSGAASKPQSFFESWASLKRSLFMVFSLESHHCLAAASDLTYPYDEAVIITDLIFSIW